MPLNLISRSPTRSAPRDPRSARRRAIAGACLTLWFAALPGLAWGKTAAGKPAVENRCGWFINPTPANAWLIDRDGEWTIGIQGGEQAEGDWPSRISEREWVSYGNASYGHGCACMKVETDRENMRIKRIVSAQGKPLAQCRRDRKLTEPGE